MQCGWTCGLVLVLAVLVAPSVWAAGTATVTTSDVGGGVTKYSIAWTSDASGDVSGNAFNVKAGRLLVLHIMPNTGATQPTDLYDMTLDDADAVDLVDALGANLSNSTGKIYQWSPALYFDGTDQIDLVISNAGNAKTGVIELLVQ